MKRFRLGFLLPCLFGLAAGALGADQPKFPHVEFPNRGVGDAEQPGNDPKQTIRQVLEKYGTVEVYDNGKKED